MDKIKKDFITVCLMAGNDDWYFRERLGWYVIARNGKDEWAVAFHGNLANIMNMKNDDDEIGTVDWERSYQEML